MDYRCYKCKEVKPQTEYWAQYNPQRKRPVHYWCKECDRKGAVRREFRYQKRHPDKHRAHQLITAALKRGDLVRQPCEVCGNPKSQAHHDDYSKPLVVRWLCDLDHKAHHRLMNQINEQTRTREEEQARPVHGHLWSCGTDGEVRTDPLP